MFRVVKFAVVLSPCVGCISTPPEDGTFSPPAFREIESGSSAVDSGWVISVMGFCPELARPFGTLTLITQQAGRRSWESWPTAVCSSAAKCGHREADSPFRVSLVPMFHLLARVTTVSWLPPSRRTTPEVKLHKPGSKHKNRVTDGQLGVQRSSMSNRHVYVLLMKFTFPFFLA